VSLNQVINDSKQSEPKEALVPLTR